MVDFFCKLTFSKLTIFPSIVYIYQFVPLPPVWKDFTTDSTTRAFGQLGCYSLGKAVNNEGGGENYGVGGISSIVKPYLKCFRRIRNDLWAVACTIKVSQL
jgi:hypothetical protein